MSISLVFRDIRWKLALPGLILIIAAVWLYPAKTVSNCSDSQWTRSLMGSTWTFSRHDGSVITDHLRLGTFGRIRGYSHPNEDRWKVQGRTLEFIDKLGHVTSRFALGVTAPIAGLKLPAADNVPLELDMHTNRHLALGTIAGISAFFGLIFLAASIWLRSGTMMDYAVSSQAHWYAGTQAAAPYLRQLRARFYFITCKSSAFTLLGAWFVLACTMASMPAYVPDEAWFFFEAFRSGKAAVHDGEWVRQIVFHRNAFGYGGFWWSLYTGLTIVWDSIYGIFSMPVADAVLAVSPDVGKVSLWEYVSPVTLAPMILMRMLALAAVAWFGTLLVRTARTGAGALLAAAVLVTMPIAWWAGKLASPELLAAALFAVAVLRWFHFKRVLPALLIASFALSMKLTIAPVYGVFFCFVMWECSRQPGFTVRRLIGYTLACVAFILIGNSWLLYDPRAGIEQLLMLAHAYAPNADLKRQSDLLLRLHPEMWEGTNFGSLKYWTGSFGLIAASALAAIFMNRRFAAFLFIGCTAQYLFMLTQPPHTWYWFPAALPLVISFSRLGPRGAMLAGVFLLANLAPFEFLHREWSYKSQHLQELDQVTTQRNCVHDKLTAYQPDIVYDMAAVGRFMAAADAPAWKAVDYHGSFVTLYTGASAIPAGEKQVLLLGERSARAFEFVQRHADKAENIIGQCGKIKLVKIVKD